MSRLINDGYMGRPYYENQSCSGYAKVTKYGNDLEVYCSVNNGTKLMWNGKTRTSEIDFSKEGTYEIVYSTVGESNIYTREIATLHVK